jgi:hypothetical protein
VGAHERLRSYASLHLGMVVLQYDMEPLSVYDQVVRYLNMELLVVKTNQLLSLGDSSVQTIW